MNREKIAERCSEPGSMKTQIELGKAIADIVLPGSTRNLQQMQWNFSGATRDINPDLREKMEETITRHLHRTYQALRLMNQQGSYTHTRELIAIDESIRIFSLEKNSMKEAWQK